MEPKSAGRPRPQTPHTQKTKETLKEQRCPPTATGTARTHRTRAPTNQRRRTWQSTPKESGAREKNQERDEEKTQNLIRRPEHSKAKGEPNAGDT
jgi:hypothetical protein